MTKIYFGRVREGERKREKEMNVPEKLFCIRYVLLCANVFTERSASVQTLIEAAMKTYSQC